MTAKEALLERVKALTEEQAAQLLRELPPADAPPVPDLVQRIIAIWADMPD